MAIGIKFNNGCFVISDKQLEYVSNEEKVKRDFSKFITTDREFSETKTTYNRYNPKYGTEITRASIFKGLSRSATLDMMELKLKEALSYYIALQESRRNLSIKEIITNVTFIVYNDPYNKSKIKFEIKGQLAGDDDIDFGVYSQEV
jgi:hypothetical protein